MSLRALGLVLLVIVGLLLAVGLIPVSAISLGVIVMALAAVHFLPASALAPPP